MDPLKRRSRARLSAFSRQIILAGNEAVGVWYRLGFVAELRHVSEAEALAIAGRKEVLDRLVEVGLLWARESDGYEVLPQSKVA